MKEISEMKVVEVAVSFLVLSGFLFVPDRIVPIPIWPLLLGLFFLGVAVAHISTNHSLAMRQVARLMAGSGFATLGIALFVDRSHTSVPWVISLAVILGVGIIWTVWNAKGGPGER